MARPNLGRHRDPEPTALVITDPQLEANEVRGQGLATVRPASSPLTHGFPHDSSRHIRCGCHVLREQASSVLKGRGYDQWSW